LIKQSLRLGFAAFSAAWLFALGLCAAAHAETEAKLGAPLAADADIDRPILLAAPDAAAVQVPSAPGAWGGPRDGSEPTLSDRVVKYEIEATLEPKAHTVTGRERMTWRNRSARRVSSVYLHLYLNAFEGPGSTFYDEQRVKGFSFRSAASTKDGEWGHIELKRIAQGGAPVPFVFVHPDGGPDTDHTVVRLDLPTPIEPGKSAVLELEFFDQLPRVVARTGYFGSFHLIGQWFPKIAVLELPGERGAIEPRWNAHEFHLHSEFYADFGEYDVHMRVPKGFQVASTGEEQGAPLEENGQITHHFMQADVHDFAWMAADDYAPPLQATFTGGGGQNVAVKVFYPPEYAGSARIALQATLDSIRYFGDTLGPYPYRTSTCIVPPYNATEAGGMEYQTFFTTEGDAAPNASNRSELDFVTIHEFGHGYFYGLLASNEFEEPILDEGLNEYWDMRYLRAHHEDTHLAPHWLSWLGIDPTGDPFVMERSYNLKEQFPADPIGQNSWDRLSSTTFVEVYTRTATFMHDFEARFGSPQVERAFKGYYAKWHFRHPSVADFREAMIEGIGERAAVERAFDQNVYGIHAIDDRIESVRSVEQLPEPGTSFRDGKWTELTSAAADAQIDAAREAWRKGHPDAKYGGPFPFRTTIIARRDGAHVPQLLRVRFEDGSVETTPWDDDVLWRRFTFLKPVRAESAQLDPERHVLLDRDKLNDGLLVDPDPTASRRYGADFAALVQSLLALLGSW
jgi:hypothetical protein